MVLREEKREKRSVELTGRSDGERGDGRKE
jgi:hypothetical protein